MNKVSGGAELERTEGIIQNTPPSSERILKGQTGASVECDWNG